MQEEFKKFEETVQHLKQYVNTKVAQAKLGAAESISDVASVFIAKMMAGFVFFLFVLFGSGAAALAIGDAFGKPWLGWLLVAGFYLLLGLIIWWARERILRIPIMNAIINRLFTRENSDHEKN